MRDDVTVKDVLSAVCVSGKIMYSYFFSIFEGVMTEEKLPFAKASVDGMLDLFDGEEFSSQSKNIAKKYNQYLTNEIERDKISFIENLNVLYTSLFLSGLNNVPMTASSYLSIDKLMRGEAWEKVKLVYKKREYNYENLGYDADHIAIEIVYLQQLCALGDKMLENPDSSEEDFESLIYELYDFLKEHVLTWIPDFLDLLIISSKKLESDFYAFNGILLYEYLKSDYKLLEDYVLNK